MKKNISHLIFPLAIFSLLLFGCTASTSSSKGDSSSSPSASSSSSSGASSSATSPESSSSGTISSATSVSSSPVSDSSISAEEGTVSITLADGASASSSSNVEIDNSSNLITIKTLGTYLVSGSLSNGSILISADETSSSDEVELILNGVSIAKNGSANAYGPIFSSLSSKTVLRLPEGTTSIITDSRKSTDSGVADSDDSAAIFSNKKLNIKGTGSLKVTSTFNNAIASDSKVRIKEATIEATSPNHVIKAHNSVVLGQEGSAGSFSLTSTTADGAGVRVDEVDSDVTTPVYGNSETDDDIAGIEIKDGVYSISSGGKGLSSEGYLYMEGGEGTISSSSDKGIKSELDLHVDGGNFIVNTPKDDCIHSSIAKVIATGGNYVLTSGSSDGNQGVKGETEVNISGGYFNVKKSYEAIAANRINMSGGTSIVNASDDGWSAGGSTSSSSSNCEVTISGGYHYVYASGDGIDSNGNLTVTGGTTIVSAPSSGGNGPLDYGDNGYSFTQSGGILIAYGTSGMATGATSGTEGSVLLGSHTSVSSGNYLVFQAGSASYALKTTRNASTTYCAFPEFVSGGSYAIGYVSSITFSSALFEEGGLYSLSSYPSATSLTSGTFSSLHVSTGGTGGGGGGFPGGGGGGGRP